jgi:L-rhamnose mutarotase
MTRRAFKMQLKPGQAAEYKARHDALWPDMLRELEAAGISDYSIYLEEATGTLFAFQKLKDHHTAKDLPTTAIVKKWWQYMGDIMETNADNSPVAIDLTEVFHMD